MVAYDIRSMEKRTTGRDVLIRTFDDYRKADAAVHKLIENGFDLQQFSVVGNEPSH